MQTWILIEWAILNSLSLLVYILFMREVKNLENAHIELVQQKNAELVRTFRLKAIKIAYGVLVVLFFPLSYLLLHLNN